MIIKRILRQHLRERTPEPPQRPPLCRSAPGSGLGLHRAPAAGAGHATPDRERGGPRQVLGGSRGAREVPDKNAVCFS